MAKTAFISYAHESPDVMDWVLRLANRLRRMGIDCDIDQFNPFPPEGWLLWMERKIDASDFVLILCSQQYLQRSLAGGPPETGLGATNESQLIRLHLYKQKGINRKYIPLVREREHRSYVPLFLQSYTHFVPDEEKDFDTLVSLMSDGAVIASRKAELEREPGFMRPWLVPHQRNAEFCERDEALSQIAQLFGDGRRESTILIHGLGGVGKTECAIEYCYRSRNKYSAVLWIRAETVTVLREDLARILGELGLKPADTLEEQITTLVAWLEKNQLALLVLDNVDAATIPSALFRPPGAQVLVTSRWQDRAEGADRVALSSLTAQGGVAMLHRLSAYPIRLDSLGPADLEGVQEVAALLGNIPLALSQAGAFIRQQKNSFADFFERLRRREVTPQNALYECWRLNFDQLSTNHPQSAGVLRLASFLYSDLIPIALLRVSFIESGTDESSARERMEYLLKPLVNLTFVSRQYEQDTLSIHRLVSEALRQHVGPDSTRWREKAIDSLGKLWSFVNDGSIESHVAGLVEQSDAMYELIKTVGVRTDVAGRFLQRWAEAQNESSIFQKKGRQIEEILNTAIDIRSRHLPSDSIELMRLKLVAGREKQKQGQSDSAIETLAPVLERIEPIGAPRDLAEGYLALARAQATQKKLEAAILSFHKAMGHAERISSDKRLGVDIRSDLADTLLKKGEVEAAEALATVAMRLAEDTQNPFDPMVAGPLGVLAEVRDRQGRHEEAAKLKFREMELNFRALHIPIVDFALFMTEQGEHEMIHSSTKIAARVFFEKAIEITAVALSKASENWTKSHPAEVELRANAGLLAVCRMTRDAERGIAAAGRVKVLAKLYRDNIQPQTFVYAVLVPASSFISAIAEEPPETQEIANSFFHEISDAVELLEEASKRLAEIPDDSAERISAKRNLGAEISKGIERGRRLLKELPDIQTMRRPQEGFPWAAAIFFLAWLAWWMFG